MPTAIGIALVSKLVIAINGCLTIRRRRSADSNAEVSAEASSTLASVANLECWESRHSSNHGLLSSDLLPCLAIEHERQTHEQTR